MKKVLFFDSWKGGLNHFLRIAPAIEKKGFQCLLIHLGSWGNEPDVQIEEVIQGLVVRDVAYYKNLKFDQIIEKEIPDLVLFLSCHTFAHRAFNRICLYKGIPTINMYHGLVRVQAVDGRKGPYKVNWRSYLRFAIIRAPKMFTKTLPTYWRALIKTKASVSEWKDCFRNLIEVFVKPSSLRVARDAQTTLCLVYADTDRKHAVQTYGFEDSQIKSVGNPDLIMFGLRPEHIAISASTDTTRFQDVLYIDTALTATGLVIKSQLEYIAHIQQTADALKLQGKNLLFKPHPETLRLYGTDAFVKAGVVIIRNEELVVKLQTCCAVITETSTLAIIPALMGIPLFLAKYGRLHELEFGEVLYSYPKATYLTDILQFSAKLAKMNFCCSLEELSKWIEVNSGPMPVERMPERVAEIVQEIVHIKARSVSAYDPRY